MHSARITTLVLAGALLAACAEQPSPTEPPRIAPSDGPSLINNGTPTGSSYGNVGALLIDENADGFLDAICTGTLISPTVFLTAGHCTDNPPGAVLYVSFQPDVLPLRLARPIIPATAYYTHPDYQFPYNDLGVVILPAGSTAGITPATLPMLGYLDQVLARSGKAQLDASLVGYGAHSLGRQKLTSGTDGVRNMADTRIQKLYPEFLMIHNNAVNAGKGGSCYGDSGGPLFLSQLDPNMIVAVTSFGDTGCKVRGGYVRLDTESARSFLGRYVTLP